MPDANTAPIIKSDQLLKHWQGHRTLTRRVIDAFPEKDLFNFSIGGMRTMSGYALEFLGMAVPTLQGITTGVWPTDDKSEKPATKADLLKAWDEATGEINKLWANIKPERWQEFDDSAEGLVAIVADGQEDRRQRDEHDGVAKPY